MSRVRTGLLFERRGYNLGRTQVVAPADGLLGPAANAAVLILFLAGGALVGPGPGEVAPPAHAPWVWALVIAEAVGAALSATGFCAVTGARQIFQQKRRMLAATGLLVIGYAAVAALAGNFKLGFEGQPAAHTDGLWNVLSLALVGLTGCLVGGCPVRQIVMTGEGNGDAFITLSGILVGGAIAHNLGLVSTGEGPTQAGQTAVVIGLVLALAFAFSIASRRATA